MKHCNSLYVLVLLKALLLKHWASQKVNLYVQIALYILLVSVAAQQTTVARHVAGLATVVCCAYRAGA